MKKTFTLIRLTAVLMLLFGLSWSTSAFAGGCTAPSAPTLTSATAPSCSSITVTWADGGGGTSHFYVYLCTSQWAGCAAGVGAPTLYTTGTTTITFTGLTASTTYYWRVRAYNSSSGGCFGGEISGNVNTGACGGGGGSSCSDGVQNGSETGVDCGGSCPACPVSGASPLCEPCSGGAHAVSNAAAITPTSSGTCVNTDINSSCTGSSSGVYGEACGAKSAGSYTTGAYRTWYKVKVPATGIVGMDVRPLSGSELQIVETKLYTSITCGAGSAISSYGFSSPDNCSYINPSNCGGGDICGPNGTLTLYTGVLGASNAYGSQSYWQGLTAGTYVWLCVDLKSLVSGATSPYTATIGTCFWDSFASNTNNFIGGAATPCGGSVGGTTRGSIQGLSLCSGFKPPNCGGGPAPSYENVSMFQMTADAVGTDITIDLTGATCTGSTAGLQFLIYTAGTTTGCTGTAQLCGSGTCTLGSCVGGNTASGMATKSYTIIGPTPGQKYFILVDGFAGSICSFNIASTGCVVLPISLVDFNAVKYAPNESLLQWETASEHNNDYFVVERSMDGIEFRAIQTVDGQGTKTSATAYEYKDKLVNATGTVYYRLKQVDFNGIETFSFTRAVNFGVQHTEGLQVSPNPVSDVCLVTVDGLEIGEDFTFTVHDVDGRTVSTKKYQDNSFEKRVIELDVSAYNNGIYFVTVSKKSGVVQSKIIKN